MRRLRRPCGRLTGDPELGWEVGDVVAYRCRDCLDVWYLELEEPDVDDIDDDSGGAEALGT